MTTYTNPEERPAPAAGSSSSRPPVVSTTWVAEALARRTPGLVVVEVDEDASAYHHAHVPGAVCLDWEDDLRDPVRNTFVDAAGFAALMDARGIINASHVVLYGGSDNRFATYTYWYFKYYGHRAVSLMDGGCRLWEAEGRETTAAETAVVATAGYACAPPDGAIRATREQVLAGFGGGGAAAGRRRVLVDSRSTDEFAGERWATPEPTAVGPELRGGRIAGAISVPASELVDPATGAFLPHDELRRLYAERGVAPDDEVVLYCHAGERAARAWLVLHELLGYPDVRLYDGSWREYAGLVDVPAEGPA